MENVSYLYKYPKCPQCLCNLIFDISDNKINLYCSECLGYSELSIDNQIVENAFSNSNKNTFYINKFSENIKCEKCKNIYCSFCYRYHQDYVSSFTPMKKVIQIENDINKLGMEKQITYKNYNIKCDKCKRQYLSGIPLPKIYERQKLSVIKENFIKAQNHLIFYTNLKNEIITELLQKINIIENSFQKNYNYHKNVFELINTLLLLVPKSSDSSSIYKSLNNFSNFHFPKVDLSNLDNLQYKIDEITNFFSHNYIIRKREEEPIKFFENYQEIFFKNSWYIQELPNKNLLFRTDYGFKIYNHFNFNYEAEFEFTETLGIIQILPLRNDLFLIHGDDYSLLLCYFDKNGYTLKYFRDNKGVQIRGSDLFYFSQNNVIFLIEEPTQNMIFIDGNYPYKRLHETNLFCRDSIVESNELSDNRILFIVYQKDKQKHQSPYYWFLLFRPKDFNLDKNVRIYNPWDLNSPCKFIELGKNKTVLYAKNNLFILNYDTGQAESQIVVAQKNQNIYKVKPVTEIKDTIAVILEFKIKIYNMTNYQQIFEIQLENEICNYIQLSNHTLLAFYRNYNNNFWIEEDALNDNIFYGIKIERNQKK